MKCNSCAWLKPYPFRFWENLARRNYQFFNGLYYLNGTSGLVAMTSASHAEGRQFDPGLVYFVAPPRFLI